MMSRPLGKSNLMIDHVRRLVISGMAKPQSNWKIFRDLKTASFRQFDKCKLNSVGIVHWM